MSFFQIAMNLTCDHISENPSRPGLFTIHDLVDYGLNNERGTLLKNHHFPQKEALNYGLSNKRSTTLKSHVNLLNHSVLLVPF